MIKLLKMFDKKLTNMMIMMKKKWKKKVNLPHYIMKPSAALTLQRSGMKDIRNAMRFRC
jgi:hypothetical protein